MSPAPMVRDGGLLVCFEEQLLRVDTFQPKWLKYRDYFSLMKWVQEAAVQDWWLAPWSHQGPAPSVFVVCHLSLGSHPRGGLGGSQNGGYSSKSPFLPNLRWEERERNEGEEWKETMLSVVTHLFEELSHKLHLITPTFTLFAKNCYGYYTSREAGICSIFFLFLLSWTHAAPINQWERKWILGSWQSQLYIPPKY